MSFNRTLFLAVCLMTNTHVNFSDASVENSLDLNGTSASWTTQEDATGNMFTTEDGEEEHRTTTIRPKDETLEEPEKPLVSRDQYNRWSAVAVRYVTPIVGCIGMVLDGIGISILPFCNINMYFRNYLLAIMITDEVYLTSELLSSVPAIVEPYDKSLASYLKASMHNYLHGFTSIAFGICNHLITIMSIERCAKIMFPLQMKNFNPMKYTFVTVGLVCLLNISARTTGFFISFAKAYYDPKLNLTMYKTASTEWAINNRPVLSVYSTCLVIILTIVPMAITVLCNFAICVSLARQMKKRNLMTSGLDTNRRQTEQARMTITLVVLAIFLTFANVPSSTAYIISKYDTERFGRGGTQFFLRALISDIGELLKVINAGNDFLVFFFTSQEIRRSLKKAIKNTFICKLMAETGSASINDTMFNDTERVSYLHSTDNTKTF